MLLNDKQITKLAEEEGMITPFTPALISELQVSEVEGRYMNIPRKVISYGVSSFGYDIRLSPNEFGLMRPVPGQIMDPKKFDPGILEPLELHKDDSGLYFIMPRHSYCMGVALEQLNIPRDISVICVGKSTYARCGVIANITPAEAGWKGHLTLEFSNSSCVDARVYANEGILQLLFLQGEPCEVSYADRNGKYQNQPEAVVAARV